LPTPSWHLRRPTTLNELYGQRFPHLSFDILINTIMISII
jgi:hypothetical protein